MTARLADTVSELSRTADAAAVRVAFGGTLPDPDLARDLRRVADLAAAALAELLTLGLHEPEKEDP